MFTSFLAIIFLLKLVKKAHFYAPSSLYKFLETSNSSVFSLKLLTALLLGYSKIRVFAIKLPFSQKNATKLKTPH